MKKNLPKIHIPKSGSSLKVGRKYVRVFLGEQFLDPGTLRFYLQYMKRLQPWQGMEHMEHFFSGPQEVNVIDVSCLKCLLHRYVPLYLPGQADLLQAVCGQYQS